MIEHKDIVISGGGIAGLVAAAAFGDAGFDVLCVDPKHPVTNRDAAGADLRTTAYLQPGQTFLQAIGVWPLVTDCNAPLQVMRIVDAASPDLVSKDFDAKDISDAPFGWNVGNWDMRDGLLRRIASLPNVVFEHRSPYHAKRWAVDVL
jgi:2-octaprenyl-6-methoxyphenol hydroxylase